MSGAQIRAAVLTVSDRCSRGEAADTSGPALAAMLREALGARVIDTACVPDEAGRIAAVFRKWGEPGRGIDLVVSTGGTGLGPRDVTPEAAEGVFERRHAGLMELARSRCSAATPRAYLSRGVAGTVGRTLILTLPGSERGATQSLGALLDVLPHAVEMLRGAAHEDRQPGRPGAASAPAGDAGREG